MNKWEDFKIDDILTKDQMDFVEIKNMIIEIQNSVEG